MLAERDNIVAKWPNIYQLEGVAYNVALSGPTAVYRFYKTDGTHFFTATVSERDNVIARWPNIYKYEGPAFYIN